MKAKNYCNVGSELAIRYHCSGKCANSEVWNTSLLLYVSCYYKGNDFMLLGKKHLWVLDRVWIDN